MNYNFFMDFAKPPKLKHPMCRCELPVDTSWGPSRIEQIGMKAAAAILLADTLAGISIPSREEWIGVNLLARDDELPPRKERAI